MESQSQEQSIEQPMLPAPPEPDTVSGSTALVTYDHYDILAHPERDRPEQFQEEVRKLKNRFTVLDTEVRKGGKVVVRGIAQMIPALAEMEPFLSRKGEHHEPHYVKMLVAAGLPTWSEYLAQLAEEFEISVRKIQRRLEEHRGHPKERQPRRLSGGGRSAAPKPTNKRTNAAQATAAKAATKNLADAKKELGVAAAAGNVQAAAIIAEYEQAVTTAASSTLTNENNSTSDNGVVINSTESDSSGVRLAEEGFLFTAPPASEPEKVAASPDKLGPSVGKLTAEPDWKQVLVELLAVLEQSGDRLPLVVLKEKRKVESLLAGKGAGRSEGATFTTPTRRYNKVMKLDAEGNRRWSVMTEGEKKAWGTFETEFEADEAIANLNSPVVSLSDIADGSKKLPVRMTLDCAGNSSIHGGAV